MTLLYYVYAFISESSAIHNSVAIPDHQKPLVIYNRVPKTGSTSFVNVAYDLHSRNAFRVLHVNITGNSHLLSIYDQVFTLSFHTLLKNLYLSSLYILSFFNILNTISTKYYC